MSTVWDSEARERKQRFVEMPKNGGKFAEVQ
jgi:hypothetical protein